MVQPSYNTTTSVNFSLGGGDLFGTAAMISLAAWGEVGVIKEFSSISELKNYYKSGKMFEAGKQFFNGGGKSLKTVRVAGTDKSKATLDLLNTATPAITLDAKYEGIFGNDVSIAVTDNGSNRDVVLTVNGVTEKYLDLASNTLIAAAINAGSVYVTVTKLTDDLVDAVTSTNLAGGDDGNTITITDYGTIINGVLLTSDWDYLLTPEQVADSFHNTVASYIVDRATDENKYSTYIAGVDKFEAIATTLARTAVDTNGNLVVCHTAIFDGTTEADLADTTKWLDGTYTAAVYTGKLCSLPVNDSPTFKTIDTVGGKTLLATGYTNSEQESLVAAGFTVVGKTFSNTYGAIMAVTRTGDSSLWSFQLDSKRKVDFMKANVYDISKGYIGQANDLITRNALKSSVTAFMSNTAKDRIIQSSAVEVLKGVDPRAVIINTDVLLISEVDYITFNLTLNV